MGDWIIQFWREHGAEIIVPVIGALLLAVVLAFVTKVREGVGRGWKTLMSGSRWLVQKLGKRWRENKELRREHKKLKTGVAALRGEVGKLVGDVDGLHQRLVSGASSADHESKADQQELDILREAVTALRDTQNQIREVIVASRWLELEGRRDTYVRICRKLAPNIEVHGREPKVLARMADQDGPYSYLMPYGDGHDEWLAESALSDTISAAIRDGAAKLLLVKLDGSHLPMDIRASQVKFIQMHPGEAQRAIIRLESSAPGQLLVMDHLLAIKVILAVGHVGAILAKEGTLDPEGFPKAVNPRSI